MRKNSLYIFISLFVVGICLTNESRANNCALNKELDSAKITENALDIPAEGQSQNTPPKKKFLPLNNIVSSILQVPGNVVDRIADIPVDSIVSSTLKVPGDAVKFVADIPYGEIASSTMGISAEVLENVGEITLYIWVASLYCCHYH